MSEFKDKYKAYESKTKKTNRNGIILLIAGLAIFAAFFIYNIYTAKEKQRAAIEKQKDADILFQYNIEQIKKNEIQDSLKYVTKISQKDSLKRVIEQMQTEIKEIKNESGINQRVRQKIDLLQVKTNTIQSIVQDTITVRYYKRKADSERVVQAIKSINKPNFNLNYRDVPNDDGLKAVNTLYYGKNVKKSYVKLLHKKLLENKIEIKELKPFVSARGFEWKQDAMELGFEKPSSTTDENAKLYVRVYSYKPNKKIKYAIRNKLEAKGFQVKLYPDWPEKPSFFSDRSTVLYYHKSNKQKAIDIASILTDLTSRMSTTRAVVEAFNVKMGSGYGVSEDENKHLFIIHYNGKN